MNIPDHVPIEIKHDDISKLKELLLQNGYSSTFFQIVKPGQLFGLVKEIQFNDMVVDHHVRCFTSGKITTEIELPRLDEVWMHLTTRSISAHERVIRMLEKHNISYQVDEDLRIFFANNQPETFVRDYMEFFRWLFGGVIFWTPIGYVWKFFHGLFNGKDLV